MTEQRKLEDEKIGENHLFLSHNLIEEYDYEPSLPETMSQSSCDACFSFSFADSNYALQYQFQDNASFVKQDEEPIEIVLTQNLLSYSKRPSIINLDEELLDALIEKLTLVQKPSNNNNNKMKRSKAKIFSQTDSSGSTISTSKAAKKFPKESNFQLDDFENSEALDKGLRLHIREFLHNNKQSNAPNRSLVLKANFALKTPEISLRQSSRIPKSPKTTQVDPIKNKDDNFPVMLLMKTIEELNSAKENEAKAEKQKEELRKKYSNTALPIDLEKQCHLDLYNVILSNAEIELNVKRMHVKRRKYTKEWINKLIG